MSVAYSSLNLLHQDISIGNVMVTEDGRGVLNDWGCAMKDIPKYNRLHNTQTVSTLITRVSEVFTYSHICSGYRAHGLSCPSSYSRLRGKRFLEKFMMTWNPFSGFSFGWVLATSNLLLSGRKNPGKSSSRCGVLVIHPTEDIELIQILTAAYASEKVDVSNESLFQNPPEGVSVKWMTCSGDVSPSMHSCTN